MQCFMLGALIAVAQANVHDFWAEHHYICGVCESSVEFVISGGDMDDFVACKDGAGREFSTVCSKVRAAQHSVRTLSIDSGLNKFQICEDMKLCGEWTDGLFDDNPVWNPLLISQINHNVDSTWKAALPIAFEGMTLGQFRKSRLGAIVDADHVYSLPPKESTKPKELNLRALPTNFSSIAAWPYCASVTGHIRDQSSCGSCWAFGSTEAFNDRLCISNVTSATNAFLQLLSVEDTASCCSGFNCGFSRGCNGGQPTAAWEWFQSAGCPSGGDYDDLKKTDTCEPYSLPPCAHHTTNSSYPPCPSTEYPTPKCESQCSNAGYAKSWSADKHYAAKAYSIRTVTEMMDDLVEFGSVTAAFTVYEDFPSYSSGVYVHTTGGALGGHAIKIIGYGVENGVDYWLCNNSWNDTWGDKGFFKIKKGVNECGIESQVSSGNPKK